jgi:hypothetical protein
VEVVEVYDGKAWTPKPPAPPDEYDFDGEKYKADQIKIALKSHKNLHQFRSSLTNKEKEVSALLRSVDPVFGMSELLGNSFDEKGNYVEGSIAQQIREMLAAEFGEDKAKVFDSVAKLKRAELQDPREAEYAEREQKLNERQFELDYAEEKRNLKNPVGNEGEQGYIPGLTDDEIRQVEEFAAQMLIEDRKKDPEAPALSLDKVYKMSPLYQQKMIESVKAAAKVELDIQKGQPGGKSTATTPRARKPGDPIQITDEQAEDIYKSLHS